MPSGSLLRNWSEFLHNDDNKSELFHFLPSYVASIKLNDSKQLIIVTDGPNVRVCNVDDYSAIDHCSLLKCGRKKGRGNVQNQR